MNANKHPHAKKPRLERFANQAVLTLIVYVVLLSIGLSMGYLLWQRSTERKSFYISNAPVAFQRIIIGFAIMFNNVMSVCPANVASALTDCQTTGAVCEPRDRQDWADAHDQHGCGDVRRAVGYANAMQYEYHSRESWTGQLCPV